MNSLVWNDTLTYKFLPPFSNTDNFIYILFYFYLFLFNFIYLFIYLFIYFMYIKLF